MRDFIKVTFVFRDRDIDPFGQEEPQSEVFLIRKSEIDYVVTMHECNALIYFKKRKKLRFMKTKFLPVRESIGEIFAMMNERV